MWDKLRDDAAAALAATQTCTLATTGPAGVCATLVLCASQDLRLYLLVPRISDHLFNLEYEPKVAVTHPTWNLRGSAAILAESSGPFTAAQTQWHAVVEVAPTQICMDIQPDGAYAQMLDL